MSVGPLPFLEAHAGPPTGVLDLRARPVPTLLAWHPVLRRVDWHFINPRAAVPRLRGHAMAPDPRLRMSVRSCRD